MNTVTLPKTPSKISLVLHPSKAKAKGVYVVCKTLKERIYFGFKSYGSPEKAIKAAEKEFPSLQRRLYIREVRENMPINILFDKNEELKSFKMTPDFFTNTVQIKSTVKVGKKYKTIKRNISIGECFRDTFNEIKDFLCDSLNYDPEYDVKIMFFENRKRLQKVFELHETQMKSINF